MTEGSEPAVHWEAPVEPVGPAPGVEFAPHGARFLAYFIDTLILTAVLLGSLAIAFLALGAMGSTIGPGWLEEHPAAGPVFAIWMLLSVIGMTGYFPFFWRRGRTLGMRPVHLWVVRDVDGGPLTWKDAMLRALGFYLVSGILYLGFVWVFIDKRRRAWHDLIAGTIVIRRR